MSRPNQKPMSAPAVSIYEFLVPLRIAHTKQDKTHKMRRQTNPRPPVQNHREEASNKRALLLRADPRNNI